MHAFIAYLSALVFSYGLLISGMVNPQKIIGFLDLSGSWDPSLILVMLGSIAVGLIPFSLAQRKMKKTWLGNDMRLESSKYISNKLVYGSLIFGVGWGMSGFCPGPSILALATGSPKAIIFVIAMLIGGSSVEPLEILWLNRHSK